MSNARIVYLQRPDAGAPEAEISALSNVFRFVLDCRVKKEAALRQSRPDDVKGSKRDSRQSQYTG
jgi:hypothetical protein